MTITNNYENCLFGRVENKKTNRMNEQRNRKEMNEMLAIEIITTKKMQNNNARNNSNNKI